MTPAADPTRPALPHAPASVLHLVSRVTDSVFSFLGPATAVLAQQGVRQTVVLIDDPLYRHLLPKFHKSVKLVLTSHKGDAADRLRALLEAYCAAAAASRPDVTHLHGLVCSMLATYAARSRGVALTTYFSPHGSRLIGPMRGLGNALLWTLRPFDADFGQRAIVNSGADARLLSPMVHRAVHLIESPVAEPFSALHSMPSTTPQIVTAGRTPNPLGAAQFAQCAVVLAHQVPGLRFVWLGAVDVESAARLKAAGVEVQDLKDDAERAAWLAQSWIYLAPAGALGVPSFLTEAMMLGIPSVAWKTRYHQDVVDHGVTGFLCRDMDELLMHVADLLESHPLRVQIGRAAREQARLRFDGERFRSGLLKLYEMQASHAVDRCEGEAEPAPASTYRARLGVRANRTARAMRAATSGSLLSLVTAAAVSRFARARPRRNEELDIRSVSPTEVDSLQQRYPSIARAQTDMLSMATGRDLAPESLVVAWNGERALGVAAIRWTGPLAQPLREAFHACPEIHSVEVDIGERSAGVGSRLIGYCERWALERGFERLSATVPVDNVHAYSLYLRLGYFHPAARPVDTAGFAAGRTTIGAGHFLVKEFP